MNYLSEFAERLKELIFANSLNINKLAGELKIDYKTIASYLSNSSIPTIEYIIKISNYFKRDCDYLLGFSDNESFSLDNNEINVELFINRFNELLSINNITKYSLAKKINTNRNNLSYFCINKIFPNVEIIAKIADYFGCSVEYLIGRSNKK